MTVPHKMVRLERMSDYRGSTVWLFLLYRIVYIFFLFFRDLLGIFALRPHVFQIPAYSGARVYQAVMDPTTVCVHTATQGQTVRQS